MTKNNEAVKSAKASPYLKREVTLDTTDPQLNDGLISLSISSETPVKRLRYQEDGIQEYQEILDHSDIKNVDLSLLKNVFIDHDTSLKNMIGSIHEKYLDEEEKKVRVKIKLLKDDPLSERIKKLIDQKHLSTVSIGYEIVDILEEKKNEDTGSVDIRFSFRIHELSFVGVPADPNVGIGRNDNKQVLSQKINNQNNNNMTDKNLNENSVRKDQSENIEVVNSYEKEVNEAKRKLEEISEIRKAGETFKQKELAEKCIAERKSLNDFYDSALTKLQAETSDNSIDVNKSLELNKKEQEAYSICNALRYMVLKDEGKIDQANQYRGLHNDIHEELLKSHSNKAKVRGMLIPNQVKAQKRNVMSVNNTGTGFTNSGASLAQPNYRPQDLQELIRSELVYDKVGGITLNGVSGNQVYPRQTAGTNATWETAEGANAGVTGATYENQTMGMKTISGYVPITRQFMMEADPAIEPLITGDLAQTVSNGLNQAFISGNGSSLTSIDSPIGILNTTGVNIVDPATNGSRLTYNTLIDFDGEISDENINVLNPFWIMNSKVESFLKKTAIEAGTNAEKILDPRFGKELLGDPYLKTNDVPNNISKGTGTNLSAMIYGDFGIKGASLITANFGSLELDVDRQSLILSGGIQIIIRKSCNFMFRRPSGISIKNDIITTLA